MLAAMYYAPMDIRLEERPVPRPGPGEVLLKVAAATTCGTDVKSYKRGHPLLFPHTPAGFGHEVSGIVDSTGAGVIRCSDGDAVVVANSAPCLHCYYCQRHRYSLCEHLLFLNGAYAEYLLVPEPIVRQNIYKLAPSTSFIAAALTEPLACALHGVDACSVKPGDTIIILGSGPLGLLLAALVSLQGARVIMTGHGGVRLALARYYGAEVVMDVSELSFDEQRKLLLAETEARRGADIVIEAVGTPETWTLATQVARPGGLVNFFGGCPPGTSINLATRPLHYSELTLKGVFHHTPAYFAQALELIQGKHIDVEALITARLPLASTLEALQLLLQKQGVKYALIPPAFQQLLLPAIPL
ncbi:MAG: zinc-dependent alcohol dehydrogenase [Ktedonobacteraceae bacterium]